MWQAVVIKGRTELLLFPAMAVRHPHPTGSPLVLADPTVHPWPFLWR